MLPSPLDFGGSSDDDKKLAAARADIAALKETVADLKKKSERQALLVRALFSLLSERFQLGEDELLAQFQKIETAGNLGPVKCSKCGRGVINLRHNRCQFCGEARQISSVFDLL